MKRDFLSRILAYQILEFDLMYIYLVQNQECNVSLLDKADGKKTKMIKSVQFSVHLSVKF